MYVQTIVAFTLLSSTHAAFAKEADPARLAATQGFVRVSLPQWHAPQSLVLRNAKTKTTFTFSRQPEDGPYSYGVWVPEGEYDIPDTRGQDGGRYEPIVAKQGELTELSAMLKIEIGGYEYVWLPVQHVEATGEAEAAQRRMSALIKNVTAWKPAAPPQPIKASTPKSGLGFMVDLLSEYKREVNKPPMSKQLREARTFDTLTPFAKLAVAPQAEEAGVDSDSNYYYGADFGQIRVRHAEGTWGSIDTGTLDEITAVEASGSRLVAGTLRGALRTTPHLGQTWTQARQLERDEIVTDIDHVGARWFVLAAQSAGQVFPWILTGRVRVYSAAADDLSDRAVQGIHCHQGQRRSYPRATKPVGRARTRRYLSD